MWPPSETRARHLKTITQRAGAGGKGKERASAGGKGKEPTSAEHPEQTSSRRSPTEQCPHEPRPPAQAPHLKRLPGRAGMEWRSCQTTKRKFHGTTTPRSPRRRSPQDISCRAPDAGARKTSRVERQMQELADARRVERAEYTAALDAVQPSVGDPLAEGYHASMRLVAQTLVQQFVWDQLMYGTSTVYDTSKHRDAAQVGLFRLQNVHNSVQYMLHGPNFQHKLASTERPGTWERQGRPHAEHGKAEWLDDAAQMALECSGWDAFTTLMKVKHTWNAKPADVVFKTTDTGAARSKWHVYLAAAMHQTHALGTVRLLLPISVSPCRKTCILLPIWMSTMPIEPIVHVRLAIALVLAGWSGTFSPT